MFYETFKASTFKLGKIRARFAYSPFPISNNSPPPHFRILPLRLAISTLLFLF